ncbi:unnamed protein product [Somion occarium]|uniref:Transposase Tc1-like domain-containing protein n=1 Tax=Somion occarium TaxID=3059160 RepID=A0ABP1DNH4_9APHY
MRCISRAIIEHILSLLDSGISGTKIASTVDSTGGCPQKLSSSNIHYAQCLITSGCVDTAVQVAQYLQKVIAQPVSAQTICRHVKRADRLDFTLEHRDWTEDDWKRVIWSDETKITCLGADGRKWVWKKKGEGLKNRLEVVASWCGGCMLWEGVEFMTKIRSTMDDQPLYTDSGG